MFYSHLDLQPSIGNNYARRTINLMNLNVYSQNDFDVTSPSFLFLLPSFSLLLLITRNETKIIINNTTASTIHIYTQPLEIKKKKRKKKKKSPYKKINPRNSSSYYYFLLPQNLKYKPYVFMEKLYVTELREVAFLGQ